VRLISDDGEQMGIVSIESALALAEQKMLDLAEVAPNVRPPVCKIMDYGKYQYHQKKIETKHRKMQKKAEIKGIRLGFKTGDHDIETKIKQAKKFLEEGNAVKVALIFKGREAMYRNLAEDKMKKFYDGLKDICALEAPPKNQGNVLIMVLTPKS
jgi:translation initiation factor IF-3